MVYSYSFLFLTLLLLLVLGIAVYLLVRRLNSRRDLSDGGVCGRCAYSVRGLATFICPECGGDLREVGIYTASLATSGVRLAPTLGRRLIGWSVALTVAAITVSLLVHRYCLPIVSNGQEDYKLVWPWSGAFKEVAFHSHGVHFDSPYQQPTRSLILEFVDLTLTKNDGATLTLRATIEQLGYEYETPGGRRVLQATGLDGAAIVEWMRSGGVDVSNARVAAEADEVAAVVRDATHGATRAQRASAFGGTTGGGLHTFRGRLRIATPITVFFWIVVWLIGVWRVLRKHDARQANILRNRRSGVAAALRG